MNRIGSIRAAVLLTAAVVALRAAAAGAQDVIVLGGPEEALRWLQSENWWGEAKHGEQLSAPYALITMISPRWPKTAKSIPVADKKEAFYRFLLPLVLHANVMVQERRDRLTQGDNALAAGKPLSTEELEALRRAAVLLRITDEAGAAALDNASPQRLREVIAQALYRLDVIPPGLALGQAAYESGYGTSRFATTGNALFGQWTFGGEGLVPEQQRKELGDHRVASFEWPFDSVRGYYLNLSSHPAYEDFRKLRAQLRAEGKPLTSLALADGLKSYSERGQEYVDTLKGIIRANKLDLADDAKLRDEPMRFLVSVESPEAAAEMRTQIADMRASGELAKITARMRLD
jgi:Bax protein